MKNYLEYYDNLLGLISENVMTGNSPAPQATPWLLDIHGNEFCTLIYNLRDNSYEYVSESIEKLIGLTAYEVTVKGPAGMLAGIHPDYLPWALKVLDNVRRLRMQVPVPQRLRSQLTISLPVQNKRGGYQWIELQTLPLKLDKQGNVEFLFMLAQPLPDKDGQTKKTYSYVRVPDEHGVLKKLSIAA
jgi:hypothetical protein